MNKLFKYMTLCLVGVTMALCCGDKNKENPGDDIPFKPIGGGELYPKKDGVVRLVTYNVGAFGKSAQSSPAYTAPMMKDLNADVIVMNELDRFNQRHNTDQLADFAAVMDWESFYAKAFTYKGGEFGNGMSWSKDFTALAKENLNSPSIVGAEDRCCVIVEFEKFVFVGTHLDVSSASNRIVSIQYFTPIIKQKYGSKGKPVFLAGDMNDYPDSETLRELEKDWKRISGTAASFPSNNPRSCIDYVFALKSASQDFKVEGTAVPKAFSTGSAANSSDHLPVYVDIRF